jgi:hypothetical protein
VSRLPCTVRPLQAASCLRGLQTTCTFLRICNCVNCCCFVSWTSVASNGTCSAYPVVGPTKVSRQSVSDPLAITGYRIDSGRPVWAPANYRIQDRFWEACLGHCPITGYRIDSGRPGVSCNCRGGSQCAKTHVKCRFHRNPVGGGTGLSAQTS